MPCDQVPASLIKTELASPSRAGRTKTKDEIKKQLLEKKKGKRTPPQGVEDTSIPSPAPPPPPAEEASTPAVTVPVEKATVCSQNIKEEAPAEVELMDIFRVQE